MRRRSSGREVQGILLLDKPEGSSSNEVLQSVKRLYRARKAGHTGSLDRLASGLLPICLGEATKISGFLLNADKRYHSTFRLGLRTSTGDAAGALVAERPVPPLNVADIERALARFRGPIQQIPPMHSAIKVQGQRLYKLAYQGIEVEREPRTVTIHALTLVEFAGERVTVEVHCSKGTYIRTLAEDLGEVLGCGAHVERLRRIGSGPFDDRALVSLDQLRGLAEQGFEALDGALLPMESALADWPDVSLPSQVSYYLRKGQAVMVPHAPTTGLVRIFGDGKNFLGVGEVLDDGRIAPRRLVQPRAQNQHS